MKIPIGVLPLKRQSQSSIATSCTTALCTVALLTVTLPLGGAALERYDKARKTERLQPLGEAFSLADGGPIIFGATSLPAISFVNLRALRGKSLRKLSHYPAATESLRSAA